MTIVIMLVSLGFALVLRMLIVAVGGGTKPEINAVPTRRATRVDPIAGHRPNCGCVGHR